MVGLGLGGQLNVGPLRALLVPVVCVDVTCVLEALVTCFADTNPWPCPCNHSRESPARALHVLAGVLSVSSSHMASYLFPVLAVPLFHSLLLPTGSPGLLDLWGLKSITCDCHHGHEVLASLWCQSSSRVGTLRCCNLKQDYKLSH